MPDSAGRITLRRLDSPDAHVVEALAASDGPGDPVRLLSDPSTFMLVAFDGDAPVGFVLAHDLPRRHGDPSILFVYEIEVAGSHRRMGIARALLERLFDLARQRGIRQAFVLTEPDNGPANTLYESVGGVRSEVVMWDFASAGD